VFTGVDSSGRPVQVSRTVRGGKRQAGAALAKFVAEVSSGEVAPRSSETLGQFLKLWLEHVRATKEPTTARSYESHIRAVTSVILPPSKRPLGSKQLSALRSADLDQAYAIWLKQGLSRATVRHRHNILGAALHQAVKWDRIPRDVSDLASPPALRTRKIPRVRPEQVRDLITAAESQNPTLLAAIALAAVLGARRGELCGLRWSDIDFDARLLTIERAAKHGLDGRSVVIGDTKNHEARTLALDPFALEVLRRHRVTGENIASQAGVSLDPEAYVLTPPVTSSDFDPTGRTPVRPDYITVAHKRLAASLGIEVRFHDLRHFVATQMIGAKVDPRTAAGRLGHDVVVLMRTYAAAIDENDRQAAALVGRLLRLPTTAS
jgi:integrase